MRESRFTYDNSVMAEGLGILPDDGKALKINERFPR